MFSVFPPSVVRPLTPISRDAIYICVLSGAISVNLPQNSSCEWALLKIFSRSEVKGQGHMFRQTHRLIAVRPLSVLRRHADHGVASRLTCFLFSFIRFLPPANAAW